MIQISNINSFITNLKTTRKEKTRAITTEYVMYILLTHVQKIALATGIVTLALFIRAGYLLNQERFWQNNDLYIFTYTYQNKDDESLSSDDIRMKNIEVLGVGNENVMKEVENTKRQISNFCKSEYKLDVSSKLDNLEKVYIFKQTSTFSGAITYGYIDTDEMAIYLNQEILSQNNLFKKVLIHETFHYLGLSDSVNNYDSFLIEGLTEAVTEECMNYLNMDFTPSELYIEDYKLAKQMIYADKHELVYNMLTTESFDYNAYINRIIGKNLTTIYGNDDAALTLDASLYSLYGNPYMNKEEENMLKLQAQHIVSIYCKSFNLTNQEKKMIKDYFIIPDFESIKFVYNPDTNELNFK